MNEQLLNILLYSIVYFFGLVTGQKSTNIWLNLFGFIIGLLITSIAIELIKRVGEK